MLYIGEAENVKERLIQHIRDNQANKEDLLFSSSSAAACFVLGYSVSGPKT